MKRFIVELGMGCDLHGGDVTKATARAIKDAMSHSCLCGLQEIAKPKRVVVEVKISWPRSQSVDLAALEGLFPVGEVVFREVVDGGMETTGTHYEKFGPGDQIVVSLVSITVCVE